MIKNYFLVAFRALTRNKITTVINILGLTIGIAFSTILYMYVDQELTYDRFHKKSDRIFRVLLKDNRVPENERIYASTIPILGQTLEEQYNEVDDMTRLFRFVGQVLIEKDGIPYQERNWYTTDANFFDVFDFELKFGDRNTALSSPFSVVLSPEMAIKFFGKTDVVGEVLENTSFGSVKVTGVLESFPANSHLKFDLLFSRIVEEQRWQEHLNNWTQFGSATYLLLRNPEDVDGLRNKMPALESEKLGFMDGKGHIEFQSIEDIYLRSEGIEYGVEESHGLMSYIYIFATMGIFIILIASINYINLSTAKAISRLKEIGIRKVIGAFKKNLILQFMLESFLVAGISMIFAIGLIDLILPYFNQVMGTEFDLITGGLVKYTPPILVISILIALISGCYPAFYLAGINASKSLKGNLISGKSKIGLRKVLVVVQFILSIIMISSTLLIGKQLNFVNEANLGFNDENLIVIDINSGNVRRQFQTMKNEFSKIPGVKEVAVSSRVPGEWKNISSIYVRPVSEQTINTDSTRSYFMGFDESMLSTYDISLSQGSFFPKNGEADSLQILINQTAVEKWGLEQPVGTRIQARDDSEIIEFTIIGVLEDFNFQSLHHELQPIIIGSWNNSVQSIDYFSLKFTGDPGPVIEGATAVHNQFDENSPIEYHFLDQQLASFYESERKVNRLFYMGAALSIVVACLGLFGLAAFNMERRRKELGVRKALGAGDAHLYWMILTGYLKQILVAVIIAFPFTYYLMDHWLQAFQYKVDQDFLIYLTAGSISLAVAALTVSYHSYKAIRNNPVNSLRQE